MVDVIAGLPDFYRTSVAFFPVPLCHVLLCHVFSVPIVDRMFTTTHLSNHVHDNMTSRLHQPQRVGALP